MASVFARVARRAPDRRPVLQAVGFVVVINLIGSLPGVLSSPGNAWFQALEKP